MKRQSVSEIISSLPPIDWAQMRAWADLTPAERVRTAMKASDLERNAMRDKLCERVPDLNPSDLNMVVLAYLTSVRLGPNAPQRLMELAALASTVEQL